MEWFQEWFNEDYLDLYPHRDAKQAGEQVSFLQAHLGIETGWKIGDIACGSGRHSLVLSERGFRVTGVDLSESLIRQAKNAAVAAGLECDFVRGDMRHLPLRDEAFDLTLWLFNSFGYFDDAGNCRSLAEVSRVTRTNGLLAMEYFNRRYVISNLVGAESIDGDKWNVSIERRITAKPERVEKFVTLEKDGQKRSYMESVRLYHPDMIMELCENVDLKPVASFAGYTPIPFHRDADSLLLIVQKR